MNLSDIEKETPKKKEKILSLLSKEHKKDDIVWVNDSLLVYTKVAAESKEQILPETFDFPDAILGIYYDNQLLETFPPIVQENCPSSTTPPSS